MSALVLSPDQMRAVMSDAPAIVVVAGAGSGKTEIVAHRIERLLRESEEEDLRVLAVSFTVRAAEEMRVRLATRLGDLHRRVEADTIHGFALSLLRQHGTRIGLPTEPEILTRDEDRVELFHSWLFQSGQAWPEDPSAVFIGLDLARARCETSPLLSDWRQALASVGAVDYPAMLDRALELAEGAWLSGYLKRRYQHVVVDEAQNLTCAQYRLLTEIVGPPAPDHVPTALVGDERQSIVGFAGADRRLIGRFAADYAAERIELHTNYRSARAIVDLGRVVARALEQPTEVSENVEFPAEGSVEARSLSAEDVEGRFIAGWVGGLLADGLDPRIVAPGEASTVRAEEVAVLARAAASLRPVRNALAARDIRSASASTEDDWVSSPAAKAVIEILAYHSAPGHISTRRRLAKLCGHDRTDWDNLDELLAAVPDPSVAALTGLGALTEPAEVLQAVESLELEDPDWTDDLSQLVETWRTFIDRTSTTERTFGNYRQHIARSQRGDLMSPGVRLLTVHKAQGREFKAVAVIACNEGQFPDFRATTRETMSAEARTFYVAISRPARALLLSRARQRETRYGPRTTEPSRFLRLIPQVSDKSL